MNDKKMTKTYTKPDVTAVNFKLGSSNSSGCSYSGNFADGNNCGYNDNGFMVFGMNCEIVNDGDFCYHVPAADNNVFQS